MIFHLVFDLKMGVIKYLTKHKINKAMTLIKYRNPMETVPTGFSRMIDNLLNDKWFNDSVEDFSLKTFTPRVDIAEVSNEYEVHLAVPGMKKDDFKIELENNVLTVSSEKEENTETDDNNYKRREFRYSSFNRSFSLPENIVDGEKVGAKYIDGVLHITLPKREEAKPKPVKTIKIG